MQEEKINKIGDDAYGGKEIDWNLNLDLKEKDDVKGEETAAWDRQFKNPKLLKEASQLPFKEFTPHVKNSTK